MGEGKRIALFSVLVPVSLVALGDRGL